MQSFLAFGYHEISLSCALASTVGDPGCLIVEGTRAARDARISMSLRFKNTTGDHCTTHFLADEIAIGISSQSLVLGH
jgi:hypothetical protein